MSGTVEGSGGGAGDGEPQPNSDHEDNRPMTYDELSKLSMYVNMLPGPELGRLVALILSRHPSMNFDGGEFVLDFEALEPATLRAMQKFLVNLFGNF